MIGVSHHLKPTENFPGFSAFLYQYLKFFPLVKRQCYHGKQFLHGVDH